MAELFDKKACLRVTTSGATPTFDVSTRKSKEGVDSLTGPGVAQHIKSL